MHALRLTALIAPLIFSACATTSAVVPIGNGQYEIAGSSATAMASGGGQKIKLIKVANEYCANRGKSMSLVNADSTNGQVGTLFRAGSAANADVIFRCD
jgi:hypothetical protein